MVVEFGKGGEVIANRLKVAMFAGGESRPVIAGLAVWL